MSERSVPRRDRRCTRSSGWHDQSRKEAGFRTSTQDVLFDVPFRGRAALGNT